MLKYYYGKGEHISKININSLMKELLVQIQLCRKKVNIIIHKKPPVAIVVTRTVVPVLPSTSLLFLVLTLQLPPWISRLMMSVPGTYRKSLAPQVAMLTVSSSLLHN